MATKLPKFECDASGAILHKQAEMFAMALADGKEVTDAWVDAGGKNVGTSHAYRKLWFENDVFQARVEQLKTTRLALLADERWGFPRWMVQQAFRYAQAKGDHTAMAQAAKMGIELERAANPRPFGRPAAEKPDEEAENTETPGKVGRPAKENPQTKRNAEEIRRNLMSRGLQIAPISVDEDT